MKLLHREDSTLQGNAALGVAECAKDAKCLAVLAVQDAVPPLLAAPRSEDEGHDTDVQVLEPPRRAGAGAIDSRLCQPARTAAGHISQATSSAVQ